MKEYFYYKKKIININKKNNTLIQNNKINKIIKSKKLILTYVETKVFIL